MPAKGYETIRYWKILRRPGWLSTVQRSIDFAGLNMYAFVY